MSIHINIIGYWFDMVIANTDIITSHSKTQCIITIGRHIKLTKNHGSLLGRLCDVAASAHMFMMKSPCVTGN